MNHKVRLALDENINNPFKIYLEREKETSLAIQLKASPTVSLFFPAYLMV